MPSLLLLLADEQPPSSGGGGPAAGHLQVSPAALAFPASAVGQADPTQALTLTNSGGTAITVTTAISGANAGDYTTDAPASITLAPAATATVHVGFTPGAGGTRAATISFAHGGDNSPTPVALSGTGLAPAHLTLSATTLPFADTIVGSTATLPLTLTNSGGISLTYAAALAGRGAGDYALTGAASGSISPGASLTLSVAFTPSQIGSRPAILTLTTNADNGPTTPVALSGVGRASRNPVVVMGNAGGSPVNAAASGALFLFDGSGSGVELDETAAARIDTESVAIAPDITTVYGQASFIGGNSNAGVPAGAHYTSIAVINGAPGQGMSASRGAYTDCLCLVGVSAGATSGQQQAVGGGLYYWTGDGALRPWPGSWTLPVTAIAHNAGSGGAAGTLYIGTPQGVYQHSDDITDSSRWTALGTLAREVVRLVGAPDNTGAYVLYAHVKGTGKTPDGIYRTPALAGAITGAGYDGWTPLLLHEKIIDLLCTDGNQIWVLLSGQEGSVFRYQIRGDGTRQVQAYPLPAGVRATRLHRVITAVNAATGLGPYDSVWISTPSGPGTYYLLAGAGSDWTGATWQSGNPDGSLTGPPGSALAVNSVVGTGLTIGGVFCAAFCCTNNGLYFCTAFPGYQPAGQSAWLSACGQNGLGGVDLKAMSAGQGQYLLATPTNRLFAITDTEFYVSNSNAVWWQEVTRGVLDLGVYFSALSVSAQGVLPSNTVETIGPMAQPGPLSHAAGTHLQLAGSLPTGWYWQRRLDERLNWTYRLVNSTAPYSNLMYAQISSLQTNEAVPLNQAAAALATVMVRWMAEHATPQTLLHIESTFERASSGLRRLRPTMQVRVTLQATIPAIAPNGVVVSTVAVNYNAAVFYVLSHSWEVDAAGGRARSITEVGRALRTGDPTPDEIAMALADDIKNLRLWGTRKGTG